MDSFGKGRLDQVYRSGQEVGVEGLPQVYVHLYYGAFQGKVHFQIAEA
jgi:hypothetical protein